MLSQKIKEFASFIIFIAVLLVSVISISLSLPAENEYHTFADEGTYFNQALKIKETGWQGFKILAAEYRANPDQQLFPSPIRIGFIAIASFVLKISHTYHALSMLSVLMFFLQSLFSYLFVRRHFGATSALFAGLLFCVSPLSMGLARRALSDPCYTLFTLLALFSFIDYLRWQRKKSIITFILYFTAGVLVKETTLFLLPFFAGVVLFYKYYLKTSVSLLTIIFLVFIPLVTVFSVYSLAFGGIGKVIDLIDIMMRINVTNPHNYALRYQSGPWFQYFIDFMLLSPLVALSFFLFSGYYLVKNQNKNEQLNCILLFFAYTVFIYSFLPKNIRFVEPLDMIYRVTAALCIKETLALFNISLRIKHLVSAMVLLLFMAIDIKSYHHFSIESDIYDPVSFNLLQARNVFFGVAESPLDHAFLNTSYYFYKKGNYKKCIEAAQKAAAINPKNTSAYINICSAYNELKDWDNAIIAGKRAVELDPGNQLAKNNLNWAMNQKQIDTK